MEKLYARKLEEEKQLMAKRSLIFLMVFSLVIFCSPGLMAEETEQTQEAQTQETEELEIIDTGLDPLLIIENVEVDKVVAGSDFFVSFVVRNIGTGPALNLTVVDQYDDSSTKRYFTTINEPKIEKVESKDVATINLRMKVADDAPVKNYKVKFNVNYDVVSSGMMQQRTTYTDVQIPVTYGSLDPKFTIKNVQFDPKVPDLNKPFTATIFFENISKSHAGDISVALEGGTSAENRNFWVLDLTNTKHLLNVKGEQTRMVTYQLEAEEGRKGNEVKITFTYTSGGEEKTQSEIINLPLSREGLGGSGNKPRVIISKYTLSPAKILAGNTVLLRLDIENTSDKTIHNARISIVDVESGDAIVDTVFSPVNSSNTFYIEKIPGKSTHTHEVALYVDPNAQAKTYNVPIEIRYEYEGSDTELEVRERVNIPVTQESKLEILSVEVPPMAMIGQPIPIAAEFVNVGKVALTNFRVTMEGDFPKENATYYVGNFETGMSDYYQAIVIPQEEGEIQGAVIFSYIDNNNQEVRIEEPFTLMVEGAPEMPDMEMGPDGMPLGPDGMPIRPEVSQGGFLSKLKGNWLVVLLGLAVIGQGIFIWRLKRKINANGEFFDA
jgi:hypothetical protein